jgi:predicted xylose isomerase-like sugar epimerase
MIKAQSDKVGFKITTINAVARFGFGLTITNLTEKSCFCLACSNKI